MDPTKCSYALLSSPPQYSSSSKPSNKQIDHQDYVRQDSLLVLGRRIHAEGTQESQSAWNHVDNKSGDEEGIKGSSSSNMLRLESPPPLQMNQKEFVPDAIAKGRCTPRPSKFHADILKIGAWKWTSRYNGDLVAKFYYANHRVVWEIINEGLKMKIEIDWEHISALKFTFPEGGLAILEIMLYQRPRFSKETNLQLGRGTAWQRTVDFTGGQATICRRHVLQCAPWILKKHMVTLLSSNHRLYSLSQENTQQNPCFENWHSESEVLASSNAQDLYHCNDYQQFGGQTLPMSFGTDVVGRNQDGSQSMPTVTPSSGAPSSWPQQHKTMFNHNNSSLQTDPQNPYFEQWHSESKVTGISSTQDLYPNYESGRQEFGDQVSMSTGVLNPSSDHAYSCVDTGAPSGGLQQHRNVLNRNNSSLQIEMQNAYFEHWKRPEVPLSSNTQDLYHSYDCHKFGGEQNDEQVSMSIETNVCTRNHNGSQDGMPIRIPRSAPGHSSMNICAPPGSLEHRNMNGTTNARVNPRKGQNLLTSIGASANSQVQPEDVRKLVKDIIRSAKRPASSWGQQDCSVGSSSRNPMELELNNCAFNNTSTQTFEQINSSTLPRNDGNAAIAAMVLERISHDLLDDIDMEPTGMVEDAMVMSTVNSLSNLLQQDPPAPATVQNSQAIYAAAPQVDNSMLPSTASLPCEEEQIGEIEMDQEYLSEIFKFCP
ncbi:unnamed protein product [Urochloa decumbens]|uniref:TRF2/HOY1 PH-like domain-containing protein n=1 Tax=Urochloa decumbens TaxID=240449 RepID=A0ABC9BYH9_9POAL